MGKWRSSQVRAAGLGRAHALEFARRGAKVVVNDLGGARDGTGGNSAAAEGVVAEIKAMGGEAIANGSSVTDEAGVNNMVKQVMDNWGRIDILVNNAGILRDKTFVKMSIEDFQLVVDVHLMGTVKATKAVWPIMKEQGYGRIVVTTSSSGLYGNFGQTNYGAAKLGVVGLINTLKLEGQKDNIRSNALAPTAFTRMTADLFPADTEELFSPEAVSPAAIYLASEDAPNGIVLCAGAGVFSVARVMESQPMALGREPDTAEKIAANWATISDMSKAEPRNLGGEHLTGLVNQLPGRKK
jgi:NAD(P)-dependent dehydrogenase (short-subunit alcohol dehydrogenase family)